MAVMERLLEDVDDARSWYWALMDYGTHLKKTIGNLNKLSKGYAKQSKFEGSQRQIRGFVLRELAFAPQTLNMLSSKQPDSRLLAVLEALEREGLIVASQDRYALPMHERSENA